MHMIELDVEKLVNRHQRARHLHVVFELDCDRLADQRLEERIEELCSARVSRHAGCPCSAASAATPASPHHDCQEARRRGC